MPTIVPIKVVLRGLPPDISLETFAASLGTTFSDVDSRPHIVYLEPGRICYDKTVVTSRGCVEGKVDGDLPLYEAASSLLERLNTLTFKSEAGTVFTAQASLPPYSKLPRTEESMGVDPRDGTIDTDADYKKFVAVYETLVTAQLAGKPVNWATLRDLPLSIAYHTPRVEASSATGASAGIATLVQFLVEKKLKKRAERAKEKAKSKRTVKGKPLGEGTGAPNAPGDKKPPFAGRGGKAFDGPHDAKGRGAPVGQRDEPAGRGRGKPSAPSNTQSAEPKRPHATDTSSPPGGRGRGAGAPRGGRPGR